MAVRIVDLPDLGAVTDVARFVGEHAGSGTFLATALADYIRTGQAGSALAEAIAAVAASLSAETIRAVTAESQPENGAAVLTWAASAGAVVTNGTYAVVLSWPWSGGAITSVVASAGTGSFTASITLGGTPVSGLSAISVASPTPQTTAAGTNALHAGDRIAAVITLASGSPADATLQVNFTRPKV
jgi:hypothetical protein